MTPGAASLTKSDYLDMIESGRLRYLVWEPETIVVRLLGNAACLRYAATLHARYDGRDSGAGRYWHTDYYEAPPRRVAGGVLSCDRAVEIVISMWCGFPTAAWRP